MKIKYQIVLEDEPSEVVFETYDRDEAGATYQEMQGNFGNGYLLITKEVK